MIRVESIVPNLQAYRGFYCPYIPIACSQVKLTLHYFQKCCVYGHLQWWHLNTTVMMKNVMLMLRKHATELKILYAQFWYTCLQESKSKNVVICYTIIQITTPNEWLMLYHIGVVLQPHMNALCFITHCCLFILLSPPVSHHIPSPL